MMVFMFKHTKGILVSLVVVSIMLSAVYAAKAVEVQMNTITVRDLYVGMLVAAKLRSTGVGSEDSMIEDSFRIADKMMRRRSR